MIGFTLLMTVLGLTWGNVRHLLRMLDADSAMRIGVILAASLAAYQFLLANKQVSLLGSPILFTLAIMLGRVRKELDVRIAAEEPFEEHEEVHEEMPASELGWRAPRTSARRMSAGAQASPSLGRASVRGAARDRHRRRRLEVRLGRRGIRRLGWLLGEGDFAVYGTAISLTVFTSALTDGGVQKLLRQQSGALRGTGRAGGRGRGRVVGARALILTAFAIVSPELYETDVIRPLVLVLAANVPVTAAAAFMRTRLHIDLRFRAIAIRDASTVFAQGGLTVLLAWLGFGAMSFVLPLLAVTAVEAIVLAAIGVQGSSMCEASRSRPCGRSCGRAAGSCSPPGAVCWSCAATTCAMGFVVKKPMLGYDFFGFQSAARRPRCSPRARDGEVAARTLSR